MRHDIYEGVPRTVKKYYEAGKENELERLKKRQQNKKASKLDPFKEIINKKLN
ncbi:hypothetical protein [Staphylococcus aureus]|uniref:hypothetical protein n=1 Tax=Staphylococcus aureus TaxID=1280 RepID=UPI0020BE8C89|nr:hypothetical protein [Staphylococcus aureus]